LKPAPSYYGEILERIRNVRRREQRMALLNGLLLAVISSIGAVLSVVLAEQIFAFGVTGRTLLAVAASAVVIGSAAWFAGRPLCVIAGILRSPGDHKLAAKIGHFFPDIRDRLIDAIEMHEQRDVLGGYYSPSLIDASFKDLYEAVRPLDFSLAVNTAPVRRARKFVLYSLVVIALVIGVSPLSFFSSFYRLVNFNQSFAAPIPVRFIIEPGDKEVVKGDNVAVSVRTEGKVVRELALYTRPHGQADFDVRRLTPNAGGAFRTELSALRMTTEYYAQAGDIPSAKYTISVLDRPLIRSLRVTVASPSYTRIPPKTLDDNVGDVVALAGSSVAIRIQSSKPLASADLVFGDTSVVHMTCDGAVAEGSFRVRKNVTWHCRLRDADSLGNSDPVEYTVRVIPDEYPVVEILSPARNTDCTSEMAINLFVRIKDDFGFSKLRLAHRLVQSKYEQPAAEPTFIEIPIPNPGQPQADISYHWDLSGLNLVPEDAVEYYAEVFDNDVIGGPKSARSQAFIVRLPSLEEVFSDVSKSHEQSLESMQSVAKEAEQLRKDIEEFSRDMKTSREKADWQQQKKAEELNQRFADMQKKLEETARKIDEMVQKMDENKLVSSETMQKYQELKKLMDQLNSPELRDALKKLQESMKQMSSDQSKQSMEQTKLSEEQFRENLERTIELLKRIHIEQKLDELVKRAQSMAQQQKQLADQTKKADAGDQQKRDELAKEQGDLQKKMDDLQKETSDLGQKMNEFPKEMPTEEMAKAGEQLEKKQIAKKMQRSAASMQSGDMQSASKSESEAGQDLQDFADQMQKTQQALADRQMKQIVNAMRKQLENVVELSKRQEDLKNRTRSLDPNSRQFRQDAQDQNEALSDLGKVADQMSEIGKKSFAVSPDMQKELGNAARQMDAALQQMEGRNPGGSSQAQNEAMGSLNRAAMQMQGALNGMMNGQSGGAGMAGLMSRLQQMSGQQGGINAGTQQAMGEGLSSQQQAEYRRLGSQQSGLQKSLKQLSEEAKNSGDYSRMLGDLDKIAQEMKEVQTDLEQGNVNPETLQKQDRIQSRLLESARSMRERDFEKKRKSESGKDLFKNSPPDVDLSNREGKDRLREELLKILEGKYSKDYEDLIRKYFDQLEKKEIQQ
jgi:hypothetical protein